MLAHQAACAPQRPERLLPDDFWMFQYKVAVCPLKHSHDWEKCVYAHEGEKARRRPPHCYSAVMCPEARAKKVCPRGEECPCTHHLFEYWLHPDRYMTCLCELGPSCNRAICFFAHHPSELRPLPDGLTHAPNATGSSRRRAAAAAAASAAAAAAVQAGSSSNTSPLGVRQLSTGSLASSGGSHGPSSDVLASMAYPSTASSVAMLLQQQQQAMTGGLSDPSTRPGFSALDTLSTASPAAVLSVQAVQQQQLPGRAASANSSACPSVLVLEAPPPATVSPVQDLTLLQAAQQFSQLNLNLAGSGLLSPTGTISPALGQTNSNMSHASSGSSTLGIQGLGADAQLVVGTSTTSAAMLLEAQHQQLLKSRSISPRTSPAPTGSPHPAMLAMGGLGGARMAQQLSNTAYAGLLGPNGQAQLAAMQGVMDEPPEHLSFSLWDLSTSGASPSGPTAAQQLASLAQAQLQSPSASGHLATLEGFGGFAAGNSRRNSSRASPAAAQVIDLASAAADRLLQAQHGPSAGMVALSEPLPVPAVVGSDAETAKEARLTLLRAWVNAAAGAGNAASRSADGSSMQQQDDMVLSLRSAASEGGGVGRLGRLGGRGMAVVAQDLASVLAPADMLVLAQQLQGMLQP